MHPRAVRAVTDWQTGPLVLPGHERSRDGAVWVIIDLVGVRIPPRAPKVCIDVLPPLDGSEACVGFCGVPEVYLSSRQSPGAKGEKEG